MSGLERIWMWMQNNWYLASMIVLTLFAAILLAIGFFQGKRSQQTTPNVCTLNKNLYITDIDIGQSSSATGNNNYCSGTSSSIALSPASSHNSLNDDLTGAPYLQVCASSIDNICDSDLVLTDIKIINMQDTNGNWKPVDQRCCSPSDSVCSYYPPFVVDLVQPPQTVNAGELPVPANATGCGKMGICIQKKAYRDVKATGGTFILGDLTFVSQSKGSTPACPTGYSSDGTDLHQACQGGNSIYLCKKNLV